MTRELIRKHTHNEAREFLVRWTLRGTEVELEGANTECSRNSQPHFRLEPIAARAGMDRQS